VAGFRGGLHSARTTALTGLVVGISAGARTVGAARSDPLDARAIGAGYGQATESY